MGQFGALCYVRSWPIAACQILRILAVRMTGIDENSRSRSRPDYSPCERPDCPREQPLGYYQGEGPLVTQGSHSE